jgi:hypothetical protein
MMADRRCEVPVQRPDRDFGALQLNSPYQIDETPNEIRSLTGDTPTCRDLYAPDAPRVTVSDRLRSLTDVVSANLRPLIAEAPQP